LLCPAVMMNILGPANQNGPYAIKGLKNLFLIQGLKLHVYGKKVSKPRRKLGHITVTANTIEKALSRAKRARKMIKLVVNQNI
jgi:5-(carboxyamino)imidazole ribonucleotide synthase